MFNNFIHFTADNGLNPIWNDFCDLDILNPELALLRFVVQDEDMFGDSNFIGQATYPVRRNKNLFYLNFNSGSWGYYLLINLSWDHHVESIM